MLNTNQNASAVAAPVMSLNAGQNSLAKKAQVANVATPDSKAAAKPKGVVEAQDRFLKLLVTQMKNQDPLNPMDNAQVTSQMAQLSTVSGIDKLNQTLEALSSSMISSQSLQASSMIGRIVLAPGNKIELKGGQGAAGVDLKQSADNLNVHIKDASGNVVRNLKLGGQQAGVVAIQWDGKNDAGMDLPEGSYQISASSQLGGDKAVESTLSYGLVHGVVQKPGGASLNVEKLGDVSMDAVKQIL